MMTSDAKSALSSTIKELRERLLSDLHDAVESRFRMSLRIRDAGLPADRERERRQFEERIDERVRARPDELKDDETPKEARERLRREIEKEAASTLLNRLIVVRKMEEAGLVQPAVVDGGFDSNGYKEFREWAPELCEDDAEGYETLLGYVFGELAVELPGLFGDTGVAELVPVPPETLRAVIQALNDEDLDTVWSDDTTLGWVYQYWNDPDREKLDEKLNNRGKVEPHEIASKTQLFTERYMVEWLLQNSLGSKWLAICAKNGWKPHVARASGPGENVARPSRPEESAFWRTGTLPDDPDRDGLATHGSTLARLELRRRDWRQKREAGEVELDALMPIDTPREDRWKYWVPREMPEDAPDHAPESIRDLELMDPACGSGHFLVIAFDLLVAFYKEEARHRGEEWSDKQIVESILENNLYGVDIDPRAVQIAAAALYLKAKTACEDAEPKKINLVAPQLQFANLPADDPALADFREAVTAETELSADLVDTILDALSDAYHLGTLLKIDEAVEDAIKENYGWGDSPLAQSRQVDDQVAAAKATILDELDDFLARHTAADDLGLRLHGEQLANGVRFLQINQEGRYDVVAANPPYQGASKMADTNYIEDNYEEGKHDLYAAFLMRGPQLAAEGGSSAMVTMRNWMFIKSFVDFRRQLLDTHGAELLGDLDRGAFEEIAAGPGGVATVMTLFSAQNPVDEHIALRPSPFDSVEHDLPEKQAGLVAQLRRHTFDVEKLEGIKGRPVIYWWSRTDLRAYKRATKVGEKCNVLTGLGTRNSRRFIRKSWEVDLGYTLCRTHRGASEKPSAGEWRVCRWTPLIKGAKGRRWFEPLLHVVRWHYNGFQMTEWIEHYRKTHQGGFLTNTEYYFEQGVSFSSIGNDFGARAMRDRLTT